MLTTAGDQAYEFEAKILEHRGKKTRTRHLCKETEVLEKRRSQKNASVGNGAKELDVSRVEQKPRIAVKKDRAKKASQSRQGDI